MFNNLKNEAMITMSFLQNNRWQIIDQNDTSITLALFKVMLYFISFLLVVFLAFYFTKLIAKKTSNMTRSNNIQVFDFITLSSNSKIAIVKIIDNVYILGINNNQVSVIDKLSKNDIDFNTLNSHSEQKSFNNYLEDILKNTKKLKILASNHKLKQFSKQIGAKHEVSSKDSPEDKE